MFVRHFDHCLHTLSLLFKFVTSEAIESFVSRTNALLVGTLISIRDVSVIIATLIVAKEATSHDNADEHGKNYTRLTLGPVGCQSGPRGGGVLLWIDDGDGSENVTFKMNSRFFKLYRVYSKLLKMSNVGKCPELISLGDRTRVQKVKEEFVVACLRPPYNVALHISTSQSCSDGKKMYKKA